MNTHIPRNLLRGLVLLTLLCGLCLARTSRNSESESHTVDDADPLATRDLIEHDVGNIGCTISNWGGHGNPNSTPGFIGFEYPIGSGNDFLFSAGLWVGARVNGQVRVSTCTDGDNGTGEFYPVHIGAVPAANVTEEPDWHLSSSTFAEYDGQYYVHGKWGVDDDHDWDRLTDDLNGDGLPSRNYDGGGGILRFDDDQDGMIDEEHANGIDDDGDGLIDEDTADGDANGDGDASYDPEPHIDEDPAGDISADFLDNDHDGLTDADDPDHDGDCCPGSFDDDGDGLEDEDAAARAEQEFRCVYQDDIEQDYVSSPDENHLPLVIEISQRSYAWSNGLAENIILMDFTVRNAGTQLLEDVYLAFFTDPDITALGDPNDVMDDFNYFDAARRMMVQTDDMEDFDGPGPGVFAVKVVKPPIPWNEAQFTFANFERTSGGDPGFDTDKYNLISSGTIDPPTEEPGDWRMLMAWGSADGSITIAPGETINFTVAMIGADDTAAVNVIADRLPLFGAGPIIGGVTLYTSPSSLGPYLLSAPFYDDDGVNWEDGVHINWRWQGHEASWRSTGPYSHVWFDPETASGEYYFQLPDSHANGSAIAEGDSIVFYCDGADVFGNYSTHTSYTLIAGEALLDVSTSTGPIDEFALYQNFPNPFNSSTMIQFNLPETVDVQIYIYNTLGRRAASLLDRHLPIGLHSITWDGTDSNGQPAAAGMYIYRINAGSFVEAKKMLLLR